MKKFRGIQKYNLAITPVVLFLILISGYSYASDISSIPYNDSNDKTQILPIVSTGSQVYYPSGTYYFSETDLRVSSRSIPMVWERTYRSNRVLKKNNQWVFGEPADGPLGFGWMTPWFIRIEGDAFVNEEGRYFYFQKDANGNYLPHMEAGFVLKKIASGYELIEIGANTYTFNVTGKLTSIKDPRGNTATLNCDTEGKLTSIKDIMNRQVFTFTYNAQAKISQITDIAGRTINYEYDAIGNLIKVTHGDEIIATYTYNTYHGITSKTNALSETYTIEYYPTWIDKGVAKRIMDPVGTELIKQGKEPTGHEMTFIYDFQNRVFYYTDYRGVTYKNIMNEKGQILSVEEIQNNQGIPVTKVEYLENRVTKTTDALGNVTTIQKDEWGNITRKVDPEGNEWRYTYNILSKLLSITDPMGTITKYEYDQYGDMTKETLALGTTEESITVYTYNQYNELTATTKGNATTYYTYNETGSLTEIKDTMGNTTMMTYDNVGNLLTRTQPLVGTTIYENYDFRGNPQKTTDPNGNITTYTYDVLGRVKTITNQADSSKTEYFYVTTSGTCQTCGSNGGGTGEIDYIISPEGNKIDYDYDSAGNLIKITDNEGNTINYTYDKKGNRTKEEIKDASGTIQKTVPYEYNLLNQLTKIINPDNSYTLYVYDLRGNRTTAKNPNGNVTTYAYDSLNRLQKVIQPGNIVTTYTYDKRGNLTSVKDVNGNITTYEYDTLNRLIKTVSPDTGTTTYTYDLNGNLKTKTDANGVAITYNYDTASRLTKSDFPTDTDIVYTYDNCTNGKGRICTMTDASGTTSYEYTAKGQIIKETKVIDNVTYVTEYGYDKNGNLKTMKYPSGRVITYNYSNDRVISVLKDADTIASNINYKPFGGMTGVTYGNGIVGTIGYDQQYRISSITTGGIQNLTYTYDNNGNVTGITNVLDPTKNKTYGYDALNRLTGATGTWGSLTYSYDGVGNRQTETNNTNETTYAYTTNRLNSTTGAKVYAFGYDMNGNTITENARQYVYNQNQRLIKVTESGVTKGEYVFNGFGQRAKKSISTGTVVFHYDFKGYVIAESIVTGNVTSEYVFLNNQPLANIEGNNVYYYHTDHLGTPIMMTDTNSNKIWEAEFLPFGETYSIKGTVTNNLRFPGQYYDDETQLHYNNFRDFQPKMGRYIEADPIGIKKGNNHLYNYVNNPVNMIDFNGLEGCGSGPFQVPDRYPGFNFKRCCDRHDNCYDDCNGKIKCDLAFCKCMFEEVCDPLSGFTRFACNRVASVYCLGVIGGGQGSYTWACLKKCVKKKTNT